MEEEGRTHVREAIGIEENARRGKDSREGGCWYKLRTCDSIGT
jgi:hypothetical protein